MSDDFEKAVLFTFDQTGGVSSELQAQARAMLAQVVASPDAWQLCLSRLESSSYAEVKFWCLQTLHSIIRSRTYVALPPLSRAQIKRALVAMGAAPSTGLPAFLCNKIAQAVVAIAAQEFPEAWPSFFQDLLGVLSQGVNAVDLFCRVLVAVDEDIVSLEVPRSADEARQSMRFKDSMRELALADVAAAWAQLVAAYRESAPELAASVLEAAQRYVHWIDIALVANDRFTPLLFEVLNSDQEAPRSAAAGVLTEIISKRMEPIPKLTLIQTLGLVPVCAQWAAGLPGATDDPELAARYSKLLAVLATEVLESWKKVENSVLSLAAVGLEVGDEAGAEASAACAAAAALLEALFPAVVTALRTGNDEIVLPIVSFLLSYVARVRMLQKRAGGVVSSDAAAQLPGILEAAATCARFSDDSVAFSIAPASPGEKVAAAEEEAAMAERRQELFTLFRNTAKLAPAQAYSAVGRRLEASLPCAEAPWQDVELALSLLFQLGEGAPEEAMRPGTGALAALAEGVVGAEVPAAGHRLVALALMETCSRYVKVVAQRGGPLLQRAVSLFLGPTGLGHASPSVPPRAAYLLCRVVKTLRQQLQPAAMELLRSLQPHLAAIASTPISTEFEGPAKAAGASALKGALGTGTSAADDRLYAFEAVGLLVGLGAVGEEEQAEQLWAVLGPLIAQLQANAAAEAPQLAAPQLLQQTLDALNRVSKGFGPKMCEERPSIAALLAQPLPAALGALQRFSGHKPLRSKFMAYAHRLVECLGPGIIPQLPPVLWALQASGADSADAADVLGLLSQVTVKMHDSEQLPALVSATLPENVAKVHNLLTPEWDWSGAAAMPALASSPGAARLSGPAPAGSTEDMRERAELQRAYYAFLAAVASAGLSQTVLGVAGDVLPTALNDLLQGAGTHVDPTVRKTCVSTIGRLAADWLADRNQGGSTSSVEKTQTSAAAAAAAAAGAGAPLSVSPCTVTPPIAVPGPRLPGLEEFVLQKFGCEVLIEGLASPGCNIDVRDAAAISLLAEVSAQLKAVYRLGGDAYLAHLCGVTLPKLGWPQAARDQLVGHITSSEPKVLKAFLKQALLELRQPHANGGGGAPAAGFRR